MKLEIFLDQRPWTLETFLYITGKDHTGTRFIVKPLKMEFMHHEPGQASEPSLVFSNEMSHDFLPALAHALAAAGFKQESTDAGELKATKLHLQDLQKMVFNK